MAGLRTSFIIFALYFLIFVLATPVAPHQQNRTWPSAYFALGDSFASGQAAGKYWKQDYETKTCKRFTGAYPVQLSSQLFADVKQDAWPFEFPACAFNFLSDMDRQIAELGGKKADLVTLSISGNDFGFVSLISNCVYSVAEKPLKDSACEQTRDEVRPLIEGDDLWNDYKNVVRKIMSDVLNPDSGVLVITGYPRFFATPAAGDICSKKRFPIWNGWGFSKSFIGNKLHVGVREEMNYGVDMLNARIQHEVVPLDPDRILFVDINDGFEGKRFCEPKRKDPFQANNKRVQFFSLKSKMKEKTIKPKPVETRSIDGPISTLARPLDVFTLQSRNIHTQTASFNVGVPTAMQITSVFHPKTQANLATATKIKSVVEEWRLAHGL